MMNVYFTVDTESSMCGALRHPHRRPLKADRHIFCRIGERDNGVGLIARLLGQYGFKATYFVETLATLVNGDDDTRQVFDYLLEAGQDVQLHIHPVFQFYAELLATAEENRNSLGKPNDLLSTWSEDAQMALLDRASTLFRQFARYDPIAFRAGCFAANSVTLRCLQRLGLTLDTSFNPCYGEWSFAGENLQPNRVSRIEGVWEIPVTVARTPIPEATYGLKPADPCALSFPELRAMLEAGAAQGQQHFVIVFHSFSAVKAKDETYSEMKPDRIVIRRLESLIDYLHLHPDRYRVTTFGETATDPPSVAPSPSPVASLGLVAASLRKSVQLLNRNYWL